MSMQWHELLFLHWPQRAERVRAAIPRALELDTFEGHAWIGIVPFRMHAVRPRGFPSLPRLSAFLELNVRTYVRCADKPGVWFFSLDAASRVGVRIARAAFHLPYFDARMTLRREGDVLHYGSQRTHRGAPPALFEARYGPSGGAADGALDRWLTERYGLYAQDGRGRLFRGDIHHARWPLQHAQVEIVRNAMLGGTGLQLPDVAPLAHYAEALSVVAWPLTAAGRDR